MEESIWHDPAVWVAISFLIFLVGFARYGIPPITRMLDARGNRIRDELTAAQALRAEAEALLASYKAKEKEALAEAESLLVHAKDEAERMKQQAAADMKASIDRRIAQANEKIERAESQALETIRGQIVDVAMAAARQAVTEQLKTGDDPSIAEAIKNVGRIVH